MKIQIGRTTNDFKIYLDDGTEISDQLMVQKLEFNMKAQQATTVILTIRVDNIDIITQK